MWKILKDKEYVYDGPGGWGPGARGHGPREQVWGLGVRGPEDLGGWGLGGLSPGGDGTDRITDVRTYVRTDGRKLSPLLIVL